jgi:hypothetical protein
MSLPASWEGWKESEHGFSIAGAVGVSTAGGVLVMSRR